MNFNIYFWVRFFHSRVGNKDLTQVKFLTKNYKLFIHTKTVFGKLVNLIQIYNFIEDAMNLFRYFLLVMSSFLKFCDEFHTRIVPSITAETYLGIEHFSFFMFIYRIKQEFLKKLLHEFSQILLQFFEWNSSNILPKKFTNFQGTHPETFQMASLEICLKISTGISLRILSEILKI